MNTATIIIGYQSNINTPILSPHHIHIRKDIPSRTCCRAFLIRCSFSCLLQSISSLRGSPKTAPYPPNSDIYVYIYIYICCFCIMYYYFDYYHYSYILSIYVYTHIYIYILFYLFVFLSFFIYIYIYMFIYSIRHRTI